MNAPAQPSLAYRVIHYMRPRFPYWMLALFMGEFFLAFACVFIFPPGALLMVFLGFITLGIAVITHNALESLDDAMTRGFEGHDDGETSAD